MSELNKNELQEEELSEEKIEETVEESIGETEEESVEETEEESVEESVENVAVEEFKPVEEIGEAVFVTSKEEDEVFDSPSVVFEESDCEPQKKEKGNFTRTVYDYVETFCYALALMMVLFLFVFRYVSVDGDSMKHTLHDNDKLIISNLFYTPETGDIIVINPESHGDRNDPIIKRVIATEGQTVRIDYDKWEVYVDGVKLDEPYIEPMREEMKRVFGDDVDMSPAQNLKYMEEFVVGEGQVFVMGDNRNNSKDSRSREYGEMGVNRIIGRVVIRLAPDFGFVK